MSEHIDEQLNGGKDPIWEQLGITEEVFREKEKEFTEQLKASIRKDRKRLLRHVKQTFHIPTNQEQLRALSWTHSALTNLDVRYQETCIGFFKQLPELPLRAASSTQDAYHLMHFTHAVLLSIHAPQTATFQTKPLPYDLWLDIEEGEANRYENRKALFGLLTSLLPEETPESRLTLKEIWQSLTELHEKVDELLNLNT